MKREKKEETLGKKGMLPRRHSKGADFSSSHRVCQGKEVTLSSDLVIFSNNHFKQ